MQKTTLNNRLSQSLLKEEFQGDEAGSHISSNGDNFIPKESGRTPGPQGEDIPTSASMTEHETHSGHDTAVPRRSRPGPGFWTLIGYFTLRIVFILAAISTLFFLGLYAAKLYGIYDPCETLMVSNEQCIATPYLRGLLYHVKCTKSHQCLLPGFSSIVKNEDWAFKDPAK